MYPIQPIEKDEQGTYRFKENKIVLFLLDKGPFDLNDIARQDFSQEDREQFNQLIGYSVAGFADLSCASEETSEAAWEMTEKGLTEQEARNLYLREKLAKVKEVGRELAEEIFNIHPDDLKA